MHVVSGRGASRTKMFRWWLLRWEYRHERCICNLIEKDAFENFGKLEFIGREKIREACWWSWGILEKAVSSSDSHGRRKFVRVANFFFCFYFGRVRWFYRVKRAVWKWGGNWNNNGVKMLSSNPCVPRFILPRENTLGRIEVEGKDGREGESTRGWKRAWDVERGKFLEDSSI